MPLRRRASWPQPTAVDGPVATVPPLRRRSARGGSPAAVLSAGGPRSTFV
jgi:hypothetical protein